MTTIHRLALLSALALPPAGLHGAAATIEGARQPARNRIAPGGYHTCAIKADGRVWCWGRNDYGQVGDNSRLTG